MSPRSKYKTNSGLFLKSVDNLPTTSFLNSLARSKMESRGFLRSTEHLATTIEFYDEYIKKSKKLSDWKFTNFLHRINTPSRMTQRIYDLVQNPTIVDNSHISPVDINEKILNCIRAYVPHVTEESLIIKSDLRDSFGDQVGVRVFLVFEFPDNDPDAKVEFKIVLIDPFHLVIPSKHEGKTKEEMESLIYAENEGNSLCISDWLSEQFF